MATQHPDNANPPYWETDGDGFVSVFEELEEAFSCYRDLGVNEFMWDWEGKHADASVIDKLFTLHHEYFKENVIGKDIFLTFRIPNIWCEKGYSLLRALSVVLTAEDFANDIGFYSPPLFEVILPMTESAEQMMHVKESFRKFAIFKSDVMNHDTAVNNHDLEIIPLVESVENQINIKKILDNYIELHQKNFNKKPDYIRPFLAGSDPALVSGLIPKILANKIAISEIYKCSEEHNIPMYPMIGVGSLTFRGGLNPDRIDQFINEYSGIRTVTIQSAFRYDYPLENVKQAIKELQEKLPNSKPRMVEENDKPILNSIIKKFEESYQSTIEKILGDLQSIFKAIPKRRERQLHIGLLGYGRKMGTNIMPRAISFTSALYSIGIPPELIGTGQALAKLTPNEYKILRKYYINFAEDLEDIGRYINKENLTRLIKKNEAWKLIEQDIEQIEKTLEKTLYPKTNEDIIYKNYTSNVLLTDKDKKQRTHIIVETAKIRKSLG